MNADGTFSPMHNYNQTSFEVRLRYARNEKFYQTRNLRVPITFDALILNASHVVSLKNVLCSDYTYHRTDVGMQKRFWFSAFGYLDAIIKAGHCSAWRCNVSLSGGCPVRDILLR